MCQSYVNDVFTAVGIIDGSGENSSGRYECATEAMWSAGDTLSTDFDNIPVGACLFTDRSAGDGVSCDAGDRGPHSAGHVAIYIGNGMVSENVGGIQTCSVDEWVQHWQENGGNVAWGWLNGVDFSQQGIKSVDNKKTSDAGDLKADTSNLQTTANVKSVKDNAKHGEKYHQVQQNGENCGETAFLTGVNIILGKNEYTDNNKEFYTEAFGGDSSVNLPSKGQAWLKEKGLDNKIVSSDASIATPTDLRKQLEKGNIVVSSAGEASPFLDANGNVWSDGNGVTSVGHFICFYKYKDGVFYANDPGIANGAGVAYNQDQIQAWYDGRSYHPSAVISLKDSK